MKSKLRKLVLWLALALVLAVVALLLFVMVFLGRAIKYGAETFGPRYAQAPVSVGGVDISLFSGRVEVRDLAVGNPEGFSASPAVKVGRMVIDVEVASLWSDTLVVEEINVEAPRVNYELSLDGSNIGRLVDNLKSSGAKPAAEPAPASVPVSKPAPAPRGRKVLVKDFKVSGGGVKLAATVLDGNGVDMPLPGVELKNIGSGPGGADVPEVVRQLSVAFGDSILGTVKGGGLSEAGGMLLDKATRQDPSGLLNGVKGLFDGGGGKDK